VDDRRATWLLVLAALAFVVGVVALFIAIDAKNNTTSDEDLAKSVRTEINSAIPHLKSALSSQSEAITTAGARLRRAERTQKRLAGGQAIDRGDLNKLTAQLKASNAKLNRLSDDVNGLTNDVNALKNQQNRTRDTIGTLTRRVNRLQVQVQDKKNK
jgi:outer membrane murein-binding lipoprotein Lpp